VNVSYNELNLLLVCLPTPNPSSSNFISRFRAYVVQLVEWCNTHRHSDTCYKYCNGACGDKKICRMRMPRKLVPISTIDPDTGHISMRRSDPWINNFNEYLIAACRSNMDIKFIWTGNDAKALVYYITDYVTKMSLSFHDTFSLVQKSITSLQNTSNQLDKENVIEKSRKLVLRCYNTLASQQELSGVQVASYLMNWGDHYTTHKFQGLFLIQTERFLQTELNEMRAKQNLQLASHGKLSYFVSHTYFSADSDTVTIFFFLYISSESGRREERGERWGENKKKKEESEKKKRYVAKSERKEEREKKQKKNNLR
jgi:hypothetical protein